MLLVVQESGADFDDAEQLQLDLACHSHSATSSVYSCAEVTTIMCFITNKSCLNVLYHKCRAACDLPLHEFIVPCKTRWTLLDVTQRLARQGP